MGQRTQIFLQRINKDGEIKNEMFHYQWGFGGTMYRSLIDFFLEVHDKHDVDVFSDDYNFFKLGTLHGLNITNEIHNINTIKDVTTKEFIERLQGEGDNNNGYLVIQMTEGERPYGGDESFKFGFVDNSYGIKGRYLTWQEYAKKHGGSYVDKNFQGMFTYFLKWTEMEQLKVQ